MLIIPCPWCGARDESEFSYGGTAEPLPPLEADADAWQRALYVHDNSKGWHEDLWFHAYGCQRWFVVRRHTVTQEIAGSAPPGSRP